MAQSQLFTTVINTFDEAGWAFTTVEGREVIRAGFEAHHARVELHLQVFDSLAAISVVSESPRGTASPAHRERLAELAMRVNRTLTVGNFEIDWDEGRLAFRVTNLFPKPEGDISIIRGLVHTVVGEMDRISPIEAIILQSQGAVLAGLDIRRLLEREDLLPEVSLPDSANP